MTFGRIAKILILLWIGLHVLLAFTVGATELPGEDFVFTLLFGWIHFSFSRLQRMRPAAAVVVSSIVYLIFLAFMSQNFLRWFAKKCDKSWRLKWTLQLGLVFVLMFVIGLAASGILRSIQAMAAPHVRIYERYRHRRNKDECKENLIHMGRALAEYVKQHGKYPDSIDVLYAEIGSVNYALSFEPVCPLTSWRVDATGQTVAHTAPYIYLGCGQRIDCDPSTPIVFEPLSNHDDFGIQVLSVDGNVTWLDEVGAREFLSHVDMTKAIITKAPPLRMYEPTSQPSTLPTTQPTP